jgi:26S proteasome regulatory subunit (ATPase 3-interacting protein)
MDPSEVVLKYLRDQNRPYDAEDIFNNLHQEITKHDVQKALERLVEIGTVTRMVCGMQEIYGAKQEDTNVKDFERELEDLDSKLIEASRKLAEVGRKLKSSEDLLRNLESAPTTSAAESEQKLLESTIEVLKAKLDNISKNAVNISETDKKQLQRVHESNVKKWRKRKRHCMTIVESMLGVDPNSEWALLDEVGIKTDEDVGHSLTDEDVGLSQPIM